MDAHELVKVFWKEENRKELSLYAYMLMGNKDDALDLLSDLLIEIYENPKMQDALDPVPYFKTTLRNKAYNIMKKNSRVIPYAPDMLSGAEPKLYNDVERYSIKELAAALNMSENALSQQFRRMRKKMRHEFAWMLKMMLCVLIGL